MPDDFRRKTAQRQGLALTPFPNETPEKLPFTPQSPTPRQFRNLVGELVGNGSFFQNA
jgi:hypothetical protein